MSQERKTFVFFSLYRCLFVSVFIRSFRSKEAFYYGSVLSGELIAAYIAGALVLLLYAGFSPLNPVFEDILRRRSSLFGLCCNDFCCLYKPKSKVWRGSFDVSSGCHCKRKI